MESIKPSCPICNKEFPLEEIELHVHKCLFFNSPNDQTASQKRPGDFVESPSKKPKSGSDYGATQLQLSQPSSSNGKKDINPSTVKKKGKIPLAEIVRPSSFDEYFGQEHVLGRNKMFRQLIESNQVPSMILWGPPGCGKTTLAHVIHKMTSERHDLRFVKLSATMAGVNDVKEVVQIAKNELVSMKRQTLLFMDEIHRFNKLQQDIFLPHIESGVITLIGATTENPSFYLNSALLSRCKVIVLEKLKTEDIVAILERAAHLSGIIILETDSTDIRDSSSASYAMERSVLDWLSHMCDGDARIALNSLQMALESSSRQKSNDVEELQNITLENIKDGIKRSHLLYDRKGEEHYNIISALHKSIRASDENAALYWLARMLEGGEDPIYIARRLVRAAAEDVGLIDPMALSLAVSGMQGCQLLGMPECDVILAQVVVYLARTQKSREVDGAYSRAKQTVKNHKGALPSVPLHLRNAPTRLMKDLGYGRGYNMREKDSSNLTYLPEGLQGINFFNAPSQ